MRHRCPSGLAVSVLLACGPTPGDGTNATTGADSGASTSTSTSTEMTTSTPTSGSGMTDSVEPTTDAGTTTTGGTTTADPGDTTASTTSGTTGPNFPPATCPTLCETPETIMGDVKIEPGDSTAEFVCTTRIVGDLKIVGAVDESALLGLGSLEQVDGLLRIEANPQLTGISPLGCLHTVGELQLIDLPALTDVSPLLGLTTLGKFGLYQTGVAAVPAWDGFPALHTLELIGNPQLVDLDAAAGWTVDAEGLAVRLEGDHALASIDGLAGLAVTQLLVIDAPQLASITALASMPLAGVWIEDLPQLASLAGLEGLADVSWIHLLDLPKVADLAPLAQLASVDFILEIAGMPLVNTLEPLAQLESADVVAIGACVNAGPDAGGMAGLTSLAGLDALASVHFLGVTNSPGIVSLTGAPLLETLDELHLIDLPALSPAAVDAFLAQLSQPPPSPCVGDWGMCSCFFIEQP